jgi:hypothetical protein
MSCRRTFAPAFHGLRSLGGDWRFALRAALVSHAVEHDTGTPSLLQP